MVIKASRVVHNRQVVCIVAALLAYNGIMWWGNTSHLMIPYRPLSYVANFVLLSTWFAAASFVREDKRIWGAVTVGLLTVATQLDVFLMRPELLNLTVGWPFILGLVAGVAVLAELVKDELADRAAAADAAAQHLVSVLALHPQRRTRRHVI